MNRTRRGVTIAILCLSLLVCSVSAEQGVSVYPANISIEGSNYDHPVRTIILTANQNLSDLRFLSTDLESPGGKVFPSDLIQATDLGSQMENGSLQKVSVRIDLPNATGAARYAGEFWFSSTNTTTRIPISVTVKDGYIAPFIILLIAVLASVLIFTYETRGKRRDQVLQRLGILNYHVTNDQELNADYGSRHNPFHSYLKDQIDTIHTKIQAGEIDDADTLLQSTEKTWEKWNTRRFTWINAFHNFEEFLEHSNKDKSAIRDDDRYPRELLGDSREIRFFTELREALFEGYDRAPETEKPDVFLGTISTLSQKEVQYHKEFQELRRLAELCDTITDCDACSLDDLWFSFFWISVKDDLAPFEKTLQDTAAKVKNCPKVRTLDLGLGERTRETVEGFGVTYYPGPEESVEAQSFWANIRLWLYNIGSFLITIIILVSIGFSLQYLNNPTFGSIGDYAGLALWGLLVGPFADALVKKTGKSSIGVE